MLIFPNPSRSYDASRHCVCFWGYDNSREISFMVDDAVLRNLRPGMGSDERSVLVVFDEFRDTVLAIAQKQYVQGPQNRYLLS
ncbi:DUF1488 domain-containing protein [Burkholderia sp. FERM BP-3421]|jgi:Protein of unknown function (DUF1488)|uniref:DUF1488 domain-containing protein n=1 Tax=Burkholderia sp. FERM BP-3421 TaxID=1494466 RepID=UPI00235EF9F1|nr:DUF1488 domain-containing protein [Burkholderia sp. FERM BP-3421]WDD95078.1 DUF1488 domain-containing protein [Burkholderia sp. FERM BP-3421]